MRRRALLGAAVAALALAAGPAPADAAAAVLRVQDTRIDEASGLARGLRSPRALYVQNDSGDTNRVFAIDRVTGVTLAVLRIRGASNDDWEDLAIADDAAGTPSLWIADIGDNGADRSEVRLYRVPEPSISRTDRDRPITTARAQVWRLRYPDGAHDAESLAVTPGGTAYVVTKSLTGTSGVYAVPATPGTGVQTMRRVGTVRFAMTHPAADLEDAAKQLTATGATVSPDGTLLAIRTYTDAYLWSLRRRGVPAAVATAPRRVALPAQKQGEGIAVVDGRLLIDSEGVRQPILSVAIPTLPAPLPSTATPSTSSPTTAPTPAPASSTAPAPAGRRDPGSRRGLVLGSAAAAVVLAGGAWGVWFRRRRTRARARTHAAGAAPPAGRGPDAAG